MSTPWLKRKARLRVLLKTGDDEDDVGRALDRILHGQTVIGKTAKTTEIDGLRFQDTDLQLVGTLERGQFGLIDVVKCHLDGRIYVRKTVERAFALRTREQCSPQFERDILLRARQTESVWAPHLLCAFQTPTHLSLVMHYAEGGTLWDVLESSPLSGRVTEEDMAWWTPQVISAVHWCHSQGFVHRDIKPHNFVLTPDAHVLLIDFGSAAPLDLEADGRVPRRHCLVPCGTCDYISPEILNAHEEALVALEMNADGDDERDEELYGYGFETDWWSLGAMLYEMVYGVAPFFATDIRKTYLRIVEHEKSLRFDPSVPVSALFQDLLRKFLTRADLRLGRRGIHEICDHPAFVEVNWTTLSTETAPPGLHLPRFTYAEPSVVLPAAEDDEDESHSRPFAFSALFQSSQVTSPGQQSGVQQHATPLKSSLSLPGQDDAFIGFSWGPPDDAFPALAEEEDLSSSPARGGPFDFATPRPARLSVPLMTPNPRLLSAPTTGTPIPAFHSYPFLTPMRPGAGTPHQALPRSTVRRTTASAAGTASSNRRPVSDREAMKQLADCVGLSARRKVIASGRKPRILPALGPPPSQHGRTSGSRRVSLPAVAVPDFASSSQGRLRPVVALAGSASTSGGGGRPASSEDTETESEGPPSPSPTPRPGSAMSMFSRRSGTPTITGTHSLRSGVLGGPSASASGSGFLSVPRVGRHSTGTRDQESIAAATVSSPTFEDTTFDELEDKHEAMMEDILLLEDRLDRFSASMRRSG
ncbi:kinase-like protein [Mycena metata]|uniref:non-specific serine/threonine protein kinase n=1 Tax=Mycena metata TaxID=1033252 RepID=A0AAD7NXG1_9AGAR|nr:kinase-like protein [Mycena metata]